MPSVGVSVEAVSSDLPSRLRALRYALLVDLVERDVAMRLALLAALAGEHLLLVGPPGTAKSLMARRLRHAFRGASYFERLLTRFTVPEELFGPLSIKGLQEDRYERLITSYLPPASIAFLDEIFKANSAILNALLTLLNEREFDNGVHREQTPLIAVVGASNELPDSEELAALFDRFLLRLHIGPVSAESFPALLQLRGHAQPPIGDTLRLTADDLRDIQAAAETVEVPADVLALLRDLRGWCASEKIAVSDRRWRKVVKLLQVSAWTNGRSHVSIWDAWLLQHCLWDEPEQRDKIYEWYAARVGAGAAMDPSRLTKMITSWEGQLKRDKESRSQARNDDGTLLYRGADGNPTTDTQGPKQQYRKTAALFLAPANSGDHRGYDVTEITDRTAAGKGYTVEQLGNLYVRSSQRWIAFDQWSDRNAYLTDPNNWLTETVDLPPYMEPTRHKVAYVRAAVDAIDLVMIDVEQYAAQLNAHMVSMEREIHDHLWVTPDFSGPAAATLKQTADTVVTLGRRLTEVRKGFEMLPQDTGEPKFPALAPAKPRQK
jgi:MoxR-like ATPase